MAAIGWALVGLAALTVVWVSVVYFRTWQWPKTRTYLRGMALPRGSIRALVTLWLIGGFVVFAFLGNKAVMDTEVYDKVFASLGTLAATVAGYYFGSRTGQKLDDGDSGAPTDQTKPGAQSKPAGPDATGGTGT